MKNYKQTIAILLCEKFEFVKDRFKQMPAYESLFIDMLNEANNTKYDIKIDVFYVKDMQYPQDIASYDKYIITGSYCSAYDNDKWIEKLKKFVNKLYSNDKKLVGICFGHQLLAQALGGKVIKNPNGKSVGKRLSLITDDYLKQFFPDGSFVLEYHHGDCVSVLPKNTRILSTSKHCNIDAFIENGKILSFQGHPEFDRAFGDILFESAKNSLNELEISTYTSSKLILVDSKLIGSIIFNF